MIQVHGKFKFFGTEFNSDNDIKELLGKVEEWVNENKVAPKSIGVEFLEKSNMLIMSLGYRDDEKYPVTLSMVNVGKLDSNFIFDQIETDVTTAVKRIERIICHEIFITEDNTVNMIFMCKK